MKNLFVKFLKEEDGATVIEYVIMIAVVAGIVLFAFPSLRKGILDWITGAFKDISGGVGGSHSDDYVCPDGSHTTDLSKC
ncbi:Flp family type IVb pilin [Priestia filamentosa]|uniref:Flp family type IVb pilin n=1 Tax=Priestia filamentosa TaxID=1402861 RepID=UPI00058924F2